MAMFFHLDRFNFADFSPLAARSTKWHDPKVLTVYPLDPKKHHLKELCTGARSKDISRSIFDTEFNHKKVRRG